MELLRRSFENLGEMGAGFAALPGWVTPLFSLGVLLGIWRLSRPYRGLKHPHARATHYRLQCGLALLGLLATSALLAGRILFHELAWFGGSWGERGLHGLLLLALLYPVAALGCAWVRAHLRVRRYLRAGATDPAELPLFTLAAERLQLPQPLWPRVDRGSDGSLLPQVYGFGRHSILIYPEVTEAVCAGVAPDSVEAQEALQLFFLGHELGHVRHRDSQFLCFWRELEPLLRWWPPALLCLYWVGAWFAPLPGLPVLAPVVLLQAATCFLLGSLARSAAREREFAADIAGLEAVSPERVALIAGKSESGESPLRLCFQALGDLASVAGGAQGGVLGLTSAGMSLAAVPEPAEGADRPRHPLRKWWNRLSRNVHPELEERLEQLRGAAYWFTLRHFVGRMAAIAGWQVLTTSVVLFSLLHLLYLVVYAWEHLQLPLLVNPHEYDLFAVLTLCLFPAGLALLLPGVWSLYGGSRARHLLTEDGQVAGAGCLLLLGLAGALPMLSALVGFGALWAAGPGQSAWTLLGWPTLALSPAGTAILALAIGLMGFCGLAVGYLMTALPAEDSSASHPAPLRRSLLCFAGLAGLPLVHLALVLVYGGADRTADVAVLGAYLVLAAGLCHQVSRHAGAWARVRDFVSPE